VFPVVFNEELRAPFGRRRFCRGQQGLERLAVSDGLRLIRDPGQV